MVVAEEDVFEEVDNEADAVVVLLLDGWHTGRIDSPQQR
jgi:hypothetical protein